MAIFCFDILTNIELLQIIPDTGCPSHGSDPKVLVSRPDEAVPASDAHHGQLSD